MLTLSYRQTIENYPNGGGAYIVAKENLGVIAGVTVGAALSVDYILTVAVSVSSGVEQVTSAFLPLRPYTVPICIESINKSSIRALRFVKTISDNVVAFCVSTDEQSGKEIQERYKRLKTDIPLIIKYSPFRKVVEPLLKFFESTEYDYKKGDMITVVLPQFSVKRWWHRVLHNQTRLFVERELLKHKHIVVAVMPLQLKDDDIVLKNTKY